MNKTTRRSVERRREIMEGVAAEEAAAENRAAKRESRRRASVAKAFAEFGVESAGELARAGRWDDLRSLRRRLGTIARRYER